MQIFSLKGASALVAMAMFLLAVEASAHHTYEMGDVIRPSVRSRLMMRRRATSRSGLRARLTNSSRLTVVGNPSAKWVKVRDQRGRIGYVSSRYTKRVRRAASPSTSVASNAEPFSGEFELGNVDNWASLLPSANSSYSNRRSRVSKGQKLQAVAKDPKTGRVKVKYSKNGRDYEGWVDSDRLVKATNAPQQQVVAAPIQDAPQNNQPALAPTEQSIVRPAPKPGPRKVSFNDFDLFGEDYSTPRVPKASCNSGMSQAGRVTHYFAPILRNFSTKRCKRIQGTCIIRKPGKRDRLYNVGVGFQDRDSAINGCRYGYGKRMKCLHPFKVMAADLRYHKKGDVLYFPNLRGLKIGNEYHDGYVKIIDVGGKIKGRNRFDFFVGDCKRFTKNSVCKSKNGLGYENLLGGAKYCKASKRNFQTALLKQHPDARPTGQIEFAEAAMPSGYSAQ